MNFKQMQKVLSVICAMGMMMSTAQTTVLAAQASSTETTQSDSVQKQLFFQRGKQFFQRRK